MNLIDNIVGYFNPQAKISRMQARRVLSILQKRGYDAAKLGRRNAGWSTPSTSANAEIAPNIAVLRNRARDLVRNNPYANKALRVMVSNIIGTGIVPSFSNKRIADLWNRWITECDADGHFDFYGIERLVARTERESGECLIRLRYRQESGGLSVPLQLQILEPDYIDSTKTESLKNGGYILYGIEYDSIGRRVAYWLYSEHPGEISTGRFVGLQSRRVLAEDIIHVFEKSRPGQSRGVPVFAPVMITTNDLDEYEEATLVRKAAEACITAIVESDEENPVIGTESTDTYGRTLEELAPGQVEYLKPGEKITFNNPPSSAGYGEYINARLHSIAAGCGVTYEQMTGDLSQVNYSSIRAGTLDFRREVEQYQWLTFIQLFCKPVMSAWLRAASLSNNNIKQDVTVDWTTPKWDWVDPLKDIKGEEMELANNLKSWSEGARQRGYNPDQLLEEIKKDRASFKDAGIPYPGAQTDNNQFFKS